MEDRKRTVLAGIIACVVIVAVLYSFGLNLFAPRPQLILADPDASASLGPGDDDPGDQGGISVDLTSDTVQRVIADLSRYSSYSRAVTVTYFWGENGSGTSEGEIWVKDGWSRTDMTLPSGVVEHSIVSADGFWLWYDESDQIHQGPADELTADLMQRIPTYEDVLHLRAEDITWTSLVEYDGEACIYIEANRSEKGYLDRYWISVSSGLLMAAETRLENRVVYRMTSRDLVSPMTGDASLFMLPNGADLLNGPQDQGGA